MASIDRPPAGGNLGPFALRPQRTAAHLAESGHLPDPIPARPAAPEKPWVVRTPQTFLSAKVSPYSPRVRLMMIILDGHCRGLSYMWFGNASLAEEFGCEVRNLKEILGEMEGLGLIHRVIVGRGRMSRVGIVMRRRVDPDLPAAETPEELADAVARLTARRSPPTGRKNAPAKGRESAPAKGRKNAPELRSRSSEDASSDEAAGGAAFVPRRRPEGTAPDAAPALAGGGPPAAPPPPGALAPPDALVPGRPDALAPGQLEALARLAPEQRARFDAMSPGKRAQALGPHAGGFDPVAFRVTLSDLGKILPPPPAPDAGPGELIPLLAGPDGPAHLARCTNALMVVLGDGGGLRSYGAVLKLCGEVMKRGRAPESLLEPLARTLGEIARGKEVPNPAAYWFRSVQNWDREH